MKLLTILCDENSSTNSPISDHLQVLMKENKPHFIVTQMEVRVIKKGNQSSVKTSLRTNGDLRDEKPA